MIRRFFVLSVLGFLAACGGIRDDLTEQPDAIGNFRLGHNFAVANAPQKGPFSREASDEELGAAVEQAVQDRLGRYEGGAYYHVAVGIQGYVLAQPGIPLVYSPKSVMIFEVTFFEDATQQKLNEEPIQLTVFEPCCSTPFIGSGLSKSREEQLEGLAFNAARAIERTMRENGIWFGGENEILEADSTIVSGDQMSEIQAEAEAAQAEAVEQ